jgi:hypothetical protein
MSFSHPVCKDGTIGRKIHRSLKVTKEEEARNLKAKMDALLADASYHRLSERQRAIRQQFDEVIVAAFFDCMNTDPIDYAQLRDEALPLPPKDCNGVVCPRILFVGTTGVGKTQLLQHLIGTTKENFPMRGASRTTVADTEVVAVDGSYEAAITFVSEEEVRVIVEENIKEACFFAYHDPNDKARIASKLLVDTDSRFRLNFVLGSWKETATEAQFDDVDEQAVPADEHYLAEAVTLSEAALSLAKLQQFVSQVVDMTTRGKDKAILDRNPKGQGEQQEIDEYWSSYLDRDEVLQLVEEIVGELAKRLLTATGASKWPLVFQIALTSDRHQFFDSLKLFYQNDYHLFGKLVTPLVQGIRVKGPFALSFADTTVPLGCVLLDGQGLGHESTDVTEQSKTLPPEITRKFEDSDAICLVDMAKPAMVGDAPLVISEAAARGYQDRLMIAYTHFEAVNAPNLLPNDRKSAVLKIVSGTIQAIGNLSKLQKVSLEKNLDKKIFFLSSLNKPTIGENLRLTRVELKRLIMMFQAAVKPLAPIVAVPKYNRYRVAAIVESVIATYRNVWSTNELRKYNYKIMEALTNWIGNALKDGYPKRNLYPAQYLSQRLIEAISLELEQPETWQPTKPTSEVTVENTINAIRVAVGRKIDAICRRHIIQDPRLSEWVPAYREIGGFGTTVRRARRISRILEDGAPLPTEGLGEFVEEIWNVVEASCNEVAKTILNRD